MNYAEEAEAALAQTREQGSFSVLPGMNDHDFDHCTCGIGWPMGFHHNWDCPAHCICGCPVLYEAGKSQICAYHAGGTMKVPIGPSVMTERWDLQRTEDDGPQLLSESSGSRQIEKAERGEGEAAPLP